MKIREANQGDLPKILELYKYLFPEEDYTINSCYKAIWETITRNLEFFVYFIAEHDDVPIASCCIALIPNLTRNGSPYALVENVITHPDFRNRGFGKELMQAAIQHAKDKGCYKVMLLSSAFRGGAHKFYKSLGFDGDSKKGFVLKLKG